MLEFNSKSDLLFACFNEYVYKDAKLNIDALKSYYKSNFSINNELHNRLLSIIETSRRYEDITEATFDMMLDGLNLTTKEIDSIKASIKSYSGYTSDQMAPVRERLKSVCYQAVVNDATRSSGDDPVGFVTKLKDFTYRSTGGGRLQMKKFGDLDVKSESDNYSAEGVIKSSFRFINDSYSNGGYIRGQIIVVCAPPGCFHGDTEIMTLDGKTRTIKSLVDESNDDYLYVYSIGDDMLPKVSKAEKCQVTRYVDHWVVLNIDGTTIKCTDDHKFMLIDGTYKEAKDLKPGDSLKSISRKHYSRFENSKYTTGEYEYCSTNGSNPNNPSYTHNLVKDYLCLSGRSVLDDKKYQVHHNKLTDGKFDKSNNLPSNLKVLTESDHMKLHSQHQWRTDYDNKYDQLVSAGRNTRFTSEYISSRNQKNWKNPDYREFMRSVSEKSGRDRCTKLNKSLDSYNGASLQRVMATKKYVKYLIDKGIISDYTELNESVYTSNRYGPRCPSWNSAMKYFSNDIERLYLESMSYENHTVLSVGIEYCSTPEPAYDLIDVDLYNNYTIACGAPGSGVVVHNCGKSLFVEQEAVNFAKQGKKVHMMVLGDLHEIDIAIRLTCMALNKRKREVESDILTYFEKAKSVINDNICITCVPAGIVSGREYVDWMLTDGKEFDVLIADYDANFRKDYSNSMYDEYGQLYDSFTELTDAGKLLFVCTQPKIGYWGNEVIELEGFGESSRKQQICDMGITIGRRSSSPNRIGKMKIVKGRKCDVGAVANWIGTTEGLFYECDDVMYSIAIANTQKFYKTYAQLASEDENGVLNSLFSMTADKDISTTPNEVPGVTTPKVSLANSSQGITNRAKDRLSGLGMEPPESVGTQFVEFPGGVPF